MTKAQMWAQAIRLGRKLDIPVHVKTDASKPCWDGKCIRATAPNNAIHDIAHFIIAPSYRRHNINFGLGYCPDDMRGSIVVSDAHAWKEEFLASALGILWEKKLGLPWRKTHKEHNWLAVADRRWLEALKALRQRGLISPKNVPYDPTNLPHLRSNHVSATKRNVPGDRRVRQPAGRR